MIKYVDYTVIKYVDYTVIKYVDFVGFFIVSHLNALQYDKTLFSFTLFSCLK